MKSLLEQIEELEAKATPGPWSADMDGLYITSEHCPICKTKGHYMVASQPILDPESPELMQIRGWGHLSHHDQNEALRVQHSNAKLMVLLRNYLPEIKEALKKHG